MYVGHSEQWPLCSFAVCRSYVLSSPVQQITSLYYVCIVIDDDRLQPVLHWITYGTSLRLLSASAEGHAILYKDFLFWRRIWKIYDCTQTHRYSISNHIGVEVRSLLMDADINRWGEWQYLKMLTFNLHLALTPSRTSFVSFFPAEFYPFSFLPSAYNVFLSQFNILLLSLFVNVAFVTIILLSTCICLPFLH